MSICKKPTLFKNDLLPLNNGKMLPSESSPDSDDGGRE